MPSKRSTPDHQVNIVFDNHTYSSVFSSDTVNVGNEKMRRGDESQTLKIDGLPAPSMFDIKLVGDNKFEIRDVRKRPNSLGYQNEAGEVEFFRTGDKMEFDGEASIIVRSSDDKDLRLFVNIEPVESEATEKPRSQKLRESHSQSKKSSQDDKNSQDKDSDKKTNSKKKTAPAGKKTSRTDELDEVKAAPEVTEITDVIETAALDTTAAARKEQMENDKASEDRKSKKTKKNSAAVSGKKTSGTTESTGEKGSAATSKNVTTLEQAPISEVSAKLTKKASGKSQQHKRQSSKTINDAPAANGTEPLPSIEPESMPQTHLHDKQEQPVQEIIMSPYEDTDLYTKPKPKKSPRTLHVQDEKMAPSEPSESPTLEKQSKYVLDTEEQHIRPPEQKKKPTRSAAMYDLVTVTLSVPKDKVADLYRHCAELFTK